MNSTRFWKKPTPEQVDRSVVLLGQPAQARYFFDRLDNPEWIEPLRMRGSFKRPPRAQEDPSGKTISHALWPASRYLARMASDRPDLVRDIILEMTETDNVSVLEDIVGAARKMPGSTAASLVPMLRNTISRVFQHAIYAPLPELLAQLMVHLAKEGQEQTALDLAELLLTPRFEPRDPIEIQGERFVPGPNIEPVISEYEYEEVLKDQFLLVVQYVGRGAVRFLADLLEEVLARSRGRRDAPEDYSEIWRPAIEEHAQNVGSEVKSLLVAGLRDAAEAFITRYPERLRIVIEELESRPKRIYHRMALHLLERFREAPDAALLTRERLESQELFDARWPRHEYARLIRTSFATLPADLQARILGWIEVGPDVEDFQRARVEMGQPPPTEAEVLRYRRTWQRDRLALIGEGLRGQWVDYYRELTEELGEAEAPDFASRAFSWVGPTSPMGADDIKRMSVEEIVEFFGRWKGSREDFRPTPEGLGRVFSEVVRMDPQRFAQGATSFRGVDPTYVRSLFWGFESALGEHRSFEWVPVLTLARWVVEQPRDAPGREVEGRDADPDWEWCLKAIASLLRAGLQSNDLAFENREPVWNVLEALTHDPDPEHDGQDAGSMDPLTLSINSVRGEAMHAVVEYGLWLHRHFKQTGAEEEPRVGFGSMPEVARVLEQHLDPAVERTRAVRAVYGQRFPWLALLDHEWARKHADRIFPLEQADAALWDAAWNAYIVFCSPYNDPFRILTSQYLEAARRLSSDDRPHDSSRDPESHLAEHLVILYARGVIRADDEVFVRFWENARPWLAAHALVFAGQSLRRDKEPIPADVLERLRQLWERRWVAIEAAGRERGAEAAAFGWWFIADRFDRGWALGQLVNALRVAGGTRVDFKVMEMLAAVASGYPRDAVAALELFVEGEEPWKIHGWRDEIRTILQIALASADSEAKTSAQRIVQGLGARGYFDFRELLRDQ